MSFGGGSAFLFGSRAIFPLHPLQHETFPNTNVTQNGVSTRGRCWLAGQVMLLSVQQKMDLQLEQEVEVGQV